MSKLYAVTYVVEHPKGGREAVTGVVVACSTEEAEDLVDDISLTMFPKALGYYGHDPIVFECPSSLIIGDKTYAVSVDEVEAIQWS